jgi:nitrogen fixation protein NifB
MSCRFCTRQDSAQTLAGTSVRILAPESAVDRIAALIDNGTPPAGVEIAGPGEPLVNAATMTVLTKLHWLYPDLPLSVWTNGLLLPERLSELVRRGVSTLTVSINASVPATAEQIYEWIIYRGRRLEGREAAEVLLHQQWSGLANAIEAGPSVTVCSFILPGVNEQDIPLIEKRARDLGADSVRTVPFPSGQKFHS